MIRYPAYFTDGEADARARIEQVLHAKSGRGREYRFDWDEEGNELAVTVLAPLPTDIAAQRFVTAPGETVLGFTDPADVQRTLPLGYGEERRDVPPVVWRTGARSTEPHLLVVGRTGQRAPPPCCGPSPSRPSGTATSSSSTAAAPANTPA